MTLLEKRDQLLGKLEKIQSAQDRLLFLIEEGRRHPPLPESEKVESNRVEGCLSNLWFVPKMVEGCCYFQTDSDSTIVRGIAGILCDFYSGFPPEEITRVDPGFLSKVGITQHLTPNRRNALSRLWEKIRSFAQDQLT